MELFTCCTSLGVSLALSSGELGLVSCCLRRCDFVCLFVLDVISFKFAKCQEWIVKKGLLYPSFWRREIGFSGLLYEAMRFCLFICIFFGGAIYILNFRRFKNNVARLSDSPSCIYQFPISKLSSGAQGLDWLIYMSVS